MKLESLNEDSVEYIIHGTDSFYIKFPKYFTPNGDGANDEYAIQSKGISNVMLAITNKCREVYITNDFYSGFKWNGKYGNKALKKGVYCIKYEIKFTDGSSINSNDKPESELEIHLVK